MGQINEGDIVLAEASDAIVIAFNASSFPAGSPPRGRTPLSRSDVFDHHSAIEEVKERHGRDAGTDDQEKIVAMEVRNVFKFDYKAVVAAGCYVAMERSNAIQSALDPRRYWRLSYTARGASAGNWVRSGSKDDAKDGTGRYANAVDQVITTSE